MDEDDEDGEDDISEPALTTIDPPRLGAMIGPYRLERELGRGGTATVYLARHVADDRLCALKMIQVQFVGSGRLYRRLLREARVMSELRHENVAAVLDAGGPPDAPPYLVTEYVRGLRLSELIKQQGSLGPRLTAKILRAVVSGLGAAHARAIVHRDVKPSNVIVGPDGEGSGVKLLDFGLARALRLDIHGTVLTRANDFLGTPSYMAPEQIRNPGQAGPASDLYSAGMMAYLMLSGKKGRPPFDSIAALIDADLTVIPLEDQSPLGALIMRLCAVDPAHRPRGAQEVIESLDAMLPNLPERSSARPKAQPPPVPEPSLVVERSEVAEPPVAAPPALRTAPPRGESWMTGAWTTPGQIIVRLVNPQSPSKAWPLFGLVLAAIIVAFTWARTPTAIIVPVEPIAPFEEEPTAEPAPELPAARARPLPVEHEPSEPSIVEQRGAPKPSATPAMVKAKLDQLYNALEALDGTVAAARLDTLEARYFQLRGQYSPNADEASCRALLKASSSLERELTALRATN